MLISVVDAVLGTEIFINPTQVAVVFEGKNPEGVQMTMINLLNGSVGTTESLDSVVTKLQNELNRI
jgi:hypothetical protein